MFWHSLGVGSLINLVHSSNSRRDVSLIQQESLVSLLDALHRMLASRVYSQDVMYDDETSEESKKQLAEVLDQFTYPEESAEALMAMQSAFYERYRAAKEDLSRRLAGMKAEFYDMHCLAYRILPSGLSELVLDENGMARIIDEPETPELKILRTKWEKGRSQELLGKQDQLRDQFTEELRMKLIGMLHTMKDHMSAPEVCDSLTEVITEARHYGADVAEKQENARWMLEVPSVPELKAAAEEGLNELSAMRRQELEDEEASPAYQEMLQFERELASYLHQCRYELRVKRYDASDFLDLRSGLKARDEEYIDYTEALPAHLVNCLEDLGISSSDF